MTQSTVAIIIIIVLFILYLIDVFPVAVTTMIGMLVMVFTGVLSFSEAFNSLAMANACCDYIHYYGAGCGISL